MESNNEIRFTPTDGSAQQSSADWKNRNADMPEKMRDEQNFLNGAIMGAIAAVAGAVIWAVITFLVKYQIAWMSVGMAFLVGFAVRRWGRGMEKKFGILGAVLSLAGCILGNILSLALLLSQNALEFFPSMVWRMVSHPEFTMSIMSLTFSPIDLLYYGLGLYYGYKYAILPIPHGEIQIRKEEAVTVSEEKLKKYGNLTIILVGIIILFLLGTVAVGMMIAR